MKKKLLVIVLSETMLAFVLAGCGSNQSAQENSESQEVTEDTVHEQDAELESGKVELTVWAEANNFETLDGILAVAAVADKKFSMEITSGWYMYSFFGGTGLDFGINDDGVTNHCNWNTTEGAIKGTDIAEAMLNVTASPAFFSQPDNLFVESVASGEVIAGISGVWNAVAICDAWGEDYGACKLPTYTCAGQQIQAVRQQTEFRKLMLL